ncbi:MAG: putative Glycosyl transferase, family 2 [Candidatus Saccharibacteria bacterium]|nr:putative Glycosyl transferase, family 2 [Candidatus Saccharibacteria bacterium]
MSHQGDGLISVVVPLYNEAASLPGLHKHLTEVLSSLGNPYEIIYIEDGSTDESNAIISAWTATDSHVRMIALSRNFGKEAGLAAGIAQSKGDAVIMMDSDGQHPVEMIPEFIKAWKDGAQVVIGISADKKGEGAFKKVGSKLFYKLFNRFSDQPLVPGSTDFRLIDAEVRAAFLKLEEKDRITRGLIDWLGFKRSYITYVTRERQHGTATYSRRKLISLATNSFVTLTSTPIFLFGYLGVFISSLSFLLGTAIIIEQLILEDPLSWNFTGTAMLGVLIIFLVGIVLMSQGILSLYISHIHTQSKNRPLYVINHAKSAGVISHES